MHLRNFWMYPVLYANAKPSLEAKAGSLTFFFTSLSSKPRMLKCPSKFVLANTLDGIPDRNSQPYMQLPGKGKRNMYRRVRRNKKGQRKQIWYWNKINIKKPSFTLSDLEASAARKDPRRRAQWRARTADIHNCNQVNSQLRHWQYSTLKSYIWKMCRVGSTSTVQLWSWQKTVFWSNLCRVVGLFGAFHSTEA